MLILSSGQRLWLFRITKDLKKFNFTFRPSADLTSLPILKINTVYSPIINEVLLTSIFVRIFLIKSAHEPVYSPIITFKIVTKNSKIMNFKCII